MDDASGSEVTIAPEDDATPAPEDAGEERQRYPGYSIGLQRHGDREPTIVVGPPTRQADPNAVDRVVIS